MQPKEETSQQPLDLTPESAQDPNRHLLDQDQEPASEDPPQDPESPPISDSSEAESESEEAEPEAPEPDAAEAEEEPAAEPDEPADAAEEEPEEPEPEPEPAPIVYSDVRDIDLETMPSEARRYMEPALNLLAQRDHDLQKATLRFEASRKELEDVSRQMQDLDGNDRKPLLDVISAKDETINHVSDDLLSVAWQAFEALKPEAKTLPQAVQQAVADEFSGLGTRYVTGNTLQQMLDAYEYALFKSGHSRKMPQTPSAEVRKQTAVAEGNAASSPSRVGVDELGWDEIMDKHLELLE